MKEELLDWDFTGANTYNPSRKRSNDSKDRVLGAGWVQNAELQAQRV